MLSFCFLLVKFRDVIERKLNSRWRVSLLYGTLLPVHIYIHNLTLLIKSHLVSFSLHVTSQISLYLLLLFPLLPFLHLLRHPFLPLHLILLILFVSHTFFYPLLFFLSSPDDYPAVTLLNFIEWNKYIFFLSSFLLPPTFPWTIGVPALHEIPLLFLFRIALTPSFIHWSITQSVSSNGFRVLVFDRWLLKCFGFDPSLNN